MNNKTQINVNQKIEATSNNKFIKMLSSIENNKEKRLRAKKELTLSHI